jgi:hypothetical protein
MDTTRIIIKIYKMKKTLDNNEKAMSKRASEKRLGVGWWVLVGHHARKDLKIRV